MAAIDEESARRTPGSLPNLMRHASDAWQQMSQEPNANLRLLAQALLEVARAQDRFNEAQWYTYESLPATHGGTHKGGADNLAGTATPTALSATSAGAAGTPQEGFAPIDHDHPAGDLATITEASEYLALIGL